MINTTIIEKVRKLRALSQSANANEAANAAAAAEKLIQEHRIAEAELEDIAVDDAPPITDFIHESGKSAVSWRAYLIMDLCKAYSCAVWQSAQRDKLTYRTRLAWGIVGSPSDIETVKYQFAYLTTEIVRLAASHPIKLSGKREFNSFYLGAVAGIRSAMNRADEAVRVTATSAALVRLDERLERAKKALPDGLKSKSSKVSYNNDAFDAGNSAGANIHRGASLGHGGSKLLGGK